MRVTHCLLVVLPLLSPLEVYRIIDNVFKRVLLATYLARLLLLSLSATVTIGAAYLS